MALTQSKTPETDNVHNDPFSRLLWRLNHRQQHPRSRIPVPAAAAMVDKCKVAQPERPLSSRLARPENKTPSYTLRFYLRRQKRLCKHHHQDWKRPPIMDSLTATPTPKPPFGTPPPWQWRCKHCKTFYNIAVTRRCLICTESAYTGKSWTNRKDRLRRIRRNNRIPLGEFDYEYWTTYNDWRRFRVAYESDPTGWKRRTSRELKATTTNRERRIVMRRLERKRRIEITDKRGKRFIKNTYSCEKDCDYPSQCHQERWAAYKRTFRSGIRDPSGQVVGTLWPPSYDEDEPKSPLCGLLPELEPDMEGDITMTSPESIDDDDEIISAYGLRDDDDQVKKTQDTCKIWNDDDQE